MIGYSITFIPRSWNFGRLDKDHKILWAFGPIRFVYHKNIQGKFL